MTESYRITAEDVNSENAKIEAIMGKYAMSSEDRIALMAAARDSFVLAAARVRQARQ